MVAAVNDELAAQYGPNVRAQMACDVWFGRNVFGFPLSLAAVPLPGMKGIAGPGMSIELCTRKCLAGLP